MTSSPKPLQPQNRQQAVQLPEAAVKNGLKTRFYKCQRFCGRQRDLGLFGSDMGQASQHHGELICPMMPSDLL
jgi:hypothetical protein